MKAGSFIVAVLLFIGAAISFVNQINALGAVAVFLGIILLITAVVLPRSTATRPASELDAPIQGADPLLSGPLIENPLNPGSIMTEAPPTLDAGPAVNVGPPHIPENPLN